MKSQRKALLQHLVQKMKRRRKGNLVIQKKDPRKGERKSHLKENIRNILKIVTVTLNPKQTPVMKIQKEEQRKLRKKKKRENGERRNLRKRSLRRTEKTPVIQAPKSPRKNF